MRAVALTVTEKDAVVELRPCALARWLGAETVRIELIRDVDGWHSFGTHKPLRYLAHSGAIEHALDFRPVAQIALATVHAEYSWTGEL